MTPVDALLAIPFFTGSGVLIALAGLRIVQGLTAPFDHEGNPHDR